VIGDQLLQLSSRQPAGAAMMHHLYNSEVVDAYKQQLQECWNINQCAGQIVPSAAYIQLGVHATLLRWLSACMLNKLSTYLLHVLVPNLYWLLRVAAAYVCSHKAFVLQHLSLS